MLDIQDFCRQIASVESGAQPPVVKHGNLKTIRDITNVKDAAEAIVKVTNVGKAGEVYNIGSGKGVETAGVLTSLIAMSTMAKDLTKEALTKQKQYHEKALVGDITKLTEATGFAPKLSLNETLTDELAHWRMLIKHLNIGNKGL